jgi:ribosomal protein S18 acetylase RimI-like enzyme
VAYSRYNKKRIGCAWRRLFEAINPGYGFISEHTHELSVAVVSGFKNKGIGIRLIRKILVEYKKCGYNMISLSVNKSNPNVRLYKREGFQIVRGNEEDYTIIYCL